MAKSKTSKGMTYELTKAKAKKRQMYLKKLGYTNVRVRKTSAKIKAIVGYAYEITYTVHW